MFFDIKLKTNETPFNKHHYNICSCTILRYWTIWLYIYIKKKKLSTTLKDTTEKNTSRFSSSNRRSATVLAAIRMVVGERPRNVATWRVVASYPRDGRVVHRRKSFTSRCGERRGGGAQGFISSGEGDWNVVAAVKIGQCKSAIVRVRNGTVFQTSQPANAHNRRDKRETADGGPDQFRSVERKPSRGTMEDRTQRCLVAGLALLLLLLLTFLDGASAIRVSGKKKGESPGLSGA